MKNEILAQLLNQEVLTEETAQALEQSITEAIETAVNEAREEAKIAAQAEVTAQWNTERQALVETIQEHVTEAVQTATVELKEAKEQYDGMKIELAQRYVAREEQLAENVKTELSALAGDLDEYMAQIVKEHMETVTADIKKIKEDNFGRKMYNAFVSEFVAKSLGTEKLKAVAEAAKQKDTKLDEALAENARLRAKLDESARDNKKKELLAPFAGEKRKIMEAILNNVPTNKLEETVKAYSSRVLKGNSEKESTTVLAESKQTTTAPRKPAREILSEGVARNGNTQQLPSRSNETVDVDDADLRHLQKMAGINVK